MPTTPPSITALPTPPDPNDRSTFNASAYPWSVAQQTLATEVGAVATNVFGNAAEAVASATAAAGDALDTAADRVQTGLDATATAADRVQTGLDATATAADRVQTGLDAVATDADRTAVNAALASIASGPVVSVNGATGIVTLKTINGAALTGVGDIVVGSSLLRSARTSNTALTTTDKGKLIDITSGTFSQTFDVVATLADGWFCYLRNSGTGDITLDPNSSETIDGLASYVMYPGECRLVQCDGVALRSVVLSAFYKEFTSSGTFTKPPGYAIISGRVWGGGNSGARSGSSGQAVFGGGGGGCGDFAVPASTVGATETVIVGAGGAAFTGADAGGGNGGGSSSFGSFLKAYRGGEVADGGSIVQSLRASTSASPVGYEGAAKSATTTNLLSGVWGGGSTNTTSASGSSVYGGGAGGSITSGNALLLPGTSSMGGNGGAAATSANGVAGSAPGGGGGATQTGAASGAGAIGEVRIWGII